MLRRRALATPSIRPLWTNIRIFRPCLLCYPLGNKLAVAPSRRRRGRKCGPVPWLARKAEIIEHSIGVRKFAPHTDEQASAPSADPAGDELDGNRDAEQRTRILGAVANSTRLHHCGASPMKAVFLPGDKRVEIRAVEVPTPGPGEVLVQVKASCICRSDLSLYYGNAVVGGNAAGKCITGHEPAG